MANRHELRVSGSDSYALLFSFRFVRIGTCTHVRRTDAAVSVSATVEIIGLDYSACSTYVRVYTLSSADGRPRIRARACEFGLAVAVPASTMLLRYERCVN